MISLRRRPNALTRLFVVVLILALGGTLGVLALTGNDDTPALPDLDPGNAAEATPDPNATHEPAPIPTISSHDGLDAVSIAADVYRQENGVYPPTRDDLQATLPDLLDTVEYTAGDDTFCAQATDADGVTLSLTAGQEVTEGPCQVTDQPNP